MDGCLLRRALLCCCCVLVTKPKEKGLILMENLKEEEFVDLKAIERPAGGGVKTAHMRMILEALAQVKLKHKTTLHSMFAFLRFQIGHIDGKYPLTWEKRKVVSTSAQSASASPT